MTSKKNHCISSHVGCICLNQSTIQAPLLNLPKSPLNLPEKNKIKTWPPKEKHVCTLILGAIVVNSKHIPTAILRTFSQILPKFPQILSGFSPNQKFWWCDCTPISYISDPHGSLKTHGTPHVFRNPTVPRNPCWKELTYISGVPVNTTVLMLLLQSFAGKKCFGRGVLASTARFPRFFPLETLPFLAADGIADFGIAQAKHCNLIFCSFVLQIDWSKTISDGPSNNIWCKWFDQLHMFIMQRKNSSHRWKSAFPPYVTLYDETKSQFGCGYLQIAQETPESLILNSSHTAEIALLFKDVNSIVFATFVQLAWCTSR